MSPSLVPWSGEVIPLMCTANEPAVPSSPVQALAMVSAGLGYLAACDAAGLETAVQAEALIGLEQAEARHTAARAKILAAFTVQDGYQADGHSAPSPGCGRLRRSPGVRRRGRRGGRGDCRPIR